MTNRYSIYGPGGAIAHFCGDRIELWDSGALVVSQRKPDCWLPIAHYKAEVWTHWESTSIKEQQ